MTLHLEIITPEKIVFKEDVEQVSVLTENGEITILPHHVALVSKVMPGELKIVIKGKTIHMAVMGGFLEVGNNTVSILADYAIKAEDIQIAKVEEAKRRAEHLMKEKIEDNDLRVAQAELQKAILQLHIADKHRRRATA